ncbi:hypothetical protein JCM14469_40520 [Desulfatiferula olefinivorans]
MKTVKALKYIVMAALTLVLVSCGDSDENKPAIQGDPLKTIVGTAVDNGNFTTLVAAIQAAGLVDALEGEGPFTVFAPTDAAFALLPEGTVAFLLEPENIDVLTDILTYHVIEGAVFAEDALALDGRAATMLNGGKIRLNIVDGELVINLGGDREAYVTVTDIEASNGVIHVIDAVLAPEDAPMDIVDTAVDNGNFTTLAAALGAAGLVEALKGEGPFTVFAPTDAAFAALPPGTVASLLEPENIGTLTNILTYHVYEGEVYAEDAIALDGASVTMLNGGMMAIDVVGGHVVLNEGGASPATVVITDIICANGVIHVIDAVIDPTDG